MVSHTLSNRSHSKSYSFPIKMVKGRQKSDEANCHNTRSMDARSALISPGCSPTAASGVKTDEDARVAMASINCDAAGRSSRLKADTINGAVMMNGVIRTGRGGMCSKRNADQLLPTSSSAPVAEACPASVDHDGSLPNGVCNTQGPHDGTTPATVAEARGESHHCGLQTGGSPDQLGYHSQYSLEPRHYSKETATASYVAGVGASHYSNGCAGGDGSDSDDDCVVIEENYLQLTSCKTNTVSNEHDFSGFTASMRMASAAVQTRSQALKEISTRSLNVATNKAYSTMLHNTEHYHCCGDNISSGSSTCSNSSCGSSSCNSADSNISGDRASCVICYDTNNTVKSSSVPMRSPTDLPPSSDVAGAEASPLYNNKAYDLHLLVQKKRSLLPHNTSFDQSESSFTTVYDISKRGFRSVATKASPNLLSLNRKSLSPLSQQSRSIAKRGEGSFNAEPVVVDLTSPSSKVSQPTLSHSSPVLRKLFASLNNRSCFSNNNSETTSTKEHSKILGSLPLLLPSNDALVSTIQITQATPNTAENSNYSDYRSCSSSPEVLSNTSHTSAPSTPHKMQVLEDNSNLFMSPKSMKAIDRLCVESPSNKKCEPKGGRGRGRPRGRGRKRLNVEAVGMSESHEVGDIKGISDLAENPSNSENKCSFLRSRSPSKSNILSDSHYRQSDEENHSSIGSCISNNTAAEKLKNGVIKPLTRTCKVDNVMPPAAVPDTATIKAPAANRATRTRTVNNNKTSNESSDASRSSQITDFFPIRRSERKPKATLLYEKQMDIEKKILEQSEEGLKVQDFEGKGRGIVATRMFHKGEFVVEYVGELLAMKDAKIREANYAADTTKGCYMYYFSVNDVQYCLDGTEESGYLGRLVNHSRTSNNLVTKSVSVDGRPHLILVAKRDIVAGTELLYDYGDRSKEALANHPWLAY